MRKLIVKMGVLFIPIVSIFFIGYGIENFSRWKDVQNPRTRILWDGKYDGADVVVLGSSTFNSSRVDTETQTIWSRLESISGRRVFSGSLDGAQTADVVSQAKVIAASWPKNTIVFVDVAPTKFVNKTRTSSTETGNYAGRFDNLLAVDNPKKKPAIYLSNFFQPVVSRFFIYRNMNEVGTYLNSFISKNNDRELHNNRVWTQDLLALRFFEKFSSSLNGTYRESYEKYFLAPNQILQQAGIRVVFVLTPLNSELINRYAPDGGAGLTEMFDKNRIELKKFMNSHELNHLDLSDAVASECFADMVHTNACGNDVIASRMNTWLSTHLK